MARPQANGSGRFRSAYDEPTLIETVREVTLAAMPRAPETVSPAGYDAALAKDAERNRPQWPGAPGAEATRRRLGRLGWYDLLALIHSERSTKHYLAVVRRREAAAPTQEEAAAALRIVAQRLRQDTLRPNEYSTERERLVAADSRAWLHSSGLAARFPTADHIEVAFRLDDEPGWDRALAAAGLAGRTPLAEASGMDPVEVAEMFLRDVGCLVWSTRALKAYAKQKGVSLANGAPSAAVLREELAVRWLPTGAWLPPAPPPVGQRPPIAVEPMADPPVRRRLKTEWGDPEALVKGVVAAYDLAAERGERLTQRVHRRLASENPGVVPTPSVVDTRA